MSARQPTWREMRGRITTEDLGVTEYRDPESDDSWEHGSVIATAMGTDGREHALTLAYDPKTQSAGSQGRMATTLLAWRMHELGVWAEPIDTTNRFVVGTNGEYISAMNYAAGQRMTKDQALTFAAWLVMCADLGELARFTEIFDAIKAT